MLQDCKDIENNCLFKQTEMFLQEMFTTHLTYHLVIGASFFPEDTEFSVCDCIIYVPTKLMKIVQLKKYIFFSSYIASIQNLAKN